MSQKIIITNLPWEGKLYRLSGLVRDSRLLDVRMDALEQENILGNIYVGRVQRIVKNLNAAFIEIAPGVPCYYPLSDLVSPCYTHKINSPNLVQGDELLVQISREGIKTKAPSVTTNLTLNGRTLVLTLEKKNIGISSKINGDLREHYKKLISDNLTSDYGVIVRTNAQSTSDEEILSELRELTAQMEHLLSIGKTRTCFSCLRRSKEPYLKYIQNSYSGELEEIVTDLADLQNEITEFCGKYENLKETPIRLYQDKLLPLYKMYNLEKQLQRATQKHVWLNSGGSIVIEPTEALTVIDVNTGKSEHKKDRQEHFLKINLEATEEIARQIRLRNISGIIIVDFIDLDSREDQQLLMDHLKSAVGSNPIPVQVVDMTRLHLVEMTRKKVEKSLAQQLKGSEKELS